MTMMHGLNGVFGTAARKKAHDLNRLGFCQCGGEFSCGGAGKLRERPDGTFVLRCGNRGEDLTPKETKNCDKRTEHRH